MKITSRIYHIRPSLYNFNTKRGGILYQSSDHSLVNDLLKAGELTEDEAKDFPQKNIITRAMQPHLAKRYKADVYTFDDIQGGDYFFMCSDGILERLSNEALCEILAQDNLSDELKLAKIKSICENKTKDNYTCWLIPIDKTNVKETNSKNTQIIQAIEEGESTGLSVAEDPVPMITQQSKEKKNKYSFPKFSVDAENFNTEKLLLYIDLLVIGIMLVISLWFLIKSIV